MEPLAFVEVMRHGQVQHRIPIYHLPATIGRAYDNAVIIDDPFVEPRHARLEQDAEGNLWLVELPPVAPDPMAREVVSDIAGLSYSLGRVHVRIRTPGHRVAPTKRERTARFGIDRWLSHPPWQWGALLGALGILTLHGYLGSTEDFVRSRAGPAMLILLLLVSWSGLWAFGTRLVTHRFRYLGHLAMSASALAVLVSCWSALGYVRFVFAPNPLLIAADYFVDAVGFVLFLLGHMLIAGVASVTRMTWAAVGGVFLVAALSIVDDNMDSGGDPGLPVATELKPLPAAAIPTRSVGAFFREARVVQARVDQSRL